MNPHFAEHDNGSVDRESHITRDGTSGLHKSLTAEDLMQLADKIDPFDLDSRRAFVAQNNDQIRAARIHQLLRPGNRNMRIFTSLREARQWLGCD
jgi:hypothetical protein